MKRLFILLAILGTAVTVWAEGKSLFITFTDGSKAEFVMAGNPAVTMANDELTVEWGSSKVAYPLWRVAKFTFGASSVIPGDANGDGVVDVSDVVAIVNKILEKPSASFNEQAADVNGDGVIDVSDEVAVVNIILKN